jgi:Uma2 family endonuclease
MSAVVGPLLTAAEYLAIERAAGSRSEFHDGVMYAMAGGTHRHSRLKSSCMVALGLRLRGKKCQPTDSDMRVLVPATGLYTYPDLSVVCGPPEFEDEQQDCIINPTLIVEVLSPSTEPYDRGKKFWNYRHLPTLTDYVLISAEEILIEHFTRQSSGQWLLTTMEGPEAIWRIDSLGLEIPLSEIFADL